jgi:hypothetical protein
VPACAEEPVPNPANVSVPVQYSAAIYSKLVSNAFFGYS